MRWRCRMGIDKGGNNAGMLIYLSLDNKREFQRTQGFRKPHERFLAAKAATNKMFKFKSQRLRLGYGQRFVPDLRSIQYRECRTVLPAVIDRQVLFRLKYADLTDLFGGNPACGQICHASSRKCQAYVCD